MIKAVIFDLDGTIIETESITSKSYEEMVKSYGKIPIPNEHGLIQTPGLRGDDAWKLLKEKYGIEEDTEVLRTKRRKIYIDMLKGNIEPLPGVVSFVKLLKKKGVKIALATGSAPHVIDLILSELQIQEYFNVIVNGKEVKRGKPDPECYTKASEKLGIEPQNCLVVEDAQFGTMAAKAAGMKVITIPTANTKKQDLSMADLIVPSMEDITWETIHSL